MIGSGHSGGSIDRTFYCQQCPQIQTLAQPGNPNIHLHKHIVCQKKDFELSTLPHWQNALEQHLYCYHKVFTNIYSFYFVFTTYFNF